MRKLPTALAFGFILITLWRVGQFAETRMAGSWVGWLFSIGLGAGVFISAYFTRDSITVRENGKEDQRSANVKKWAWGLLVFCVVGDGLFNLSEVWYTVNPSWEIENWLLILATFVFGLFPTFAAAGFGALQGHVDRLPQPPVKLSIWLSIRRAVVAWIDNKAQPPAQVVDNPQPEPQPEPAKVDKDAEMVDALRQPATRLKILKAIDDNPEITNAQLARNLGISPQAVSKHIKAMVDNGAPIHRKNGKAHAPVKIQ